MDLQPRAMGRSQGCSYAGRCPHVVPGICEKRTPPVRKFGQHHLIVCHLEADQLLAIAAVTGPAKTAATPAVTEVRPELPAAKAVAGPDPARLAAVAASASRQQCATTPASKADGGDWAKRALAALQGDGGTIVERAKRALELLRDK